MNRLMSVLDSVDRLLERVLYLAALSAFSLFVVLIVYQVLSRNIRPVPVIQWTEEISRFSFMWMIMLGATIGVLRSDHFLIDIFENMPRARRVTRWMRELLILVVGLIFVFEGYGFGLSGTRRISIAAGIPMTYVYMSFFVMGLFAVLFSVHRILMLIAGGVQRLDEFDVATPLVAADTIASTDLGTESIPDLDPGKQGR